MNESISNHQQPEEFEPLPDVPMPIEELTEHQEPAPKPSRGLIGTKIASLTAAGAIAFTGLGANPAKAAGPEGKKLNTPDDIQPGRANQSSIPGSNFKISQTKSDNEAEAAKRVLLASTAEKTPNPDKAAIYTARFFEKIKNHTASPLAAFNGLVVVDSKAQLYNYIDPALSWGRQLDMKDLKNYEIFGHSSNKFLVSRRPVFNYDGSRWWIGASRRSSPMYWGNLLGGLRDRYDHVRPTEQAAVADDYIWVPYDSKHVKLYEFTDAAQAPNGPQPFVGLFAMVPPKGSGPEGTKYYVDNGILDNFTCTSGWNITPENIAAFEFVHSGKMPNIGNIDVVVGPEYASAQKVIFLLKQSNVRAYNLPSNPATVKKIMLKNSKPKTTYKGTD